jgi:protein TonB
VRFEAIIATDGKVTNLKLVSGHPLLVPNATEAARQYEYQPTLLNGQPVEVVTQVDVNFTLGSAPAPVVGGVMGGIVGSAPIAEFPQGDGPRIRVGGNVQAAKLINAPKPEYPALAQQARIQGTVRFSVVIDKNGKVVNSRLDSGHPLLVPAAMEVIRQYEYQPTLLNGDPVEVTTQVDVNFSLP